MACKDSCCRNKTINVLSKHEELILNLIEQIEDPAIKAQRLSEFHKALVKEPSKPELVRGHAPGPFYECWAKPT